MHANPEPHRNQQQIHPPQPHKKHTHRQPAPKKDKCADFVPHAYAFFCAITFDKRAEKAVAIKPRFATFIAL